MQLFINIIIALALTIFILPFVATAWFYGILIAKREYQRQKAEGRPQVGLEKAIEKWENLSAEERMEVSREAEKQGKTFWLDKPSPKEEEKAMNEKVFREGFIKNPPGTSVSDTDEE